METYCATSIVDGLQVDHIFEAASPEDAEAFAKLQGWTLLTTEDLAIPIIECLETVH